MGLKQWSVEVIAPDWGERFEDWVTMFTDSDPTQVGEYVNYFLQDNPYFDFSADEAAGVVYGNFYTEDGYADPEWPTGVEVEIL